MTKPRIKQLIPYLLLATLALALVLLIWPAHSNYGLSLIHIFLPVLIAIQVALCHVLPGIIGALKDFRYFQGLIQRFFFRIEIYDIKLSQQLVRPAIIPGVYCVIPICIVRFQNGIHISLSLIHI